ncbi:MAG: rhomboid family intramembrane serine protease, partial [Leptolyngbya sp. SIO1D8]|nr:rhomboid family intramembrane serine protease [Leptolyngbya sp. SIO1D8]
MASDDPELQKKLQQLMAEVDTEAAPASVSPISYSSKPTVSSPKKGFLERLRGNLLLPLQILAIPWTQEIIDQVFFQGRWNLPVYPRSIEGIPGIFLSAFSHGDFGHLIGNSIAFAIFSWLILTKSKRDYWITFCIGWIGGGFASWLLGPQSVHGLSGVVYTLFGYLLFIGWLERRFVPDPDVKFEVFERLNLGAEKLNDQEVRNCVYRGNYNELLRLLS